MTRGVIPRWGAWSLAPPPGTLYNESSTTALRLGRGGRARRATTLPVRSPAGDDVVLDVRWHGSTATPFGETTAVVDPVAFENEPVEYAEETAWSRALREELARYPGEFVALAEGRIVAHHADFLALMWELERLGVEGPYIVSVPATGALAL